MEKKKFGTITVYTDDKAKLRKIAEREYRSMAQQLRYWIEQDQEQQHKEAV